jgi:uncharacterized phage protein gp47/JayE
MLDKSGYKRKTYDDLLNEMTTRTKQLFGEDANVSDRSVLGRLIRIMAWFLSLVWKDNEDVYYSSNLDDATGKNLDRILPRYGITRNPAEHAVGTIQINGTPDYTVPAGFTVATKLDVFFETIETIVLDSSGNGEGQIRAIQSGQSGNVGAGLITEIVNPDSNISTVTNALPTSGGREEETDLEARARAKNSGEGLGKATVPSIRASLSKLPGVRAVTVIENYMDEPDQYGTPMRSFQTFILGGDNQEIADAIFNTKAAGIRPYGDVETVVKDIGGHEHKVYFSRASEVKIYQKIVITKNPAFPVDGESKIKTALIQYIGGEDASGSLYTGLNMGDDVIHSKLISIIYKIDGIEDVTLSLSTDGINYAESNVNIDIFQVAQADAEAIEVTFNV